MKHLFLSITIFLPILLQAQIAFTKGESTLTYSLPKVEFLIEVYADKITETPGEFYQYSERFLATTDVITQPTTRYKFRHIKLIANVLPDKERTFAFIPSKRKISSNITVNNQGILCGINIKPENIVKEKETVVLRNEKIEKKQLLPLNEEYMLAGSLSKMAEGAAKQIYRIRENRIDLLSGNVENMPMDGASLKVFIEQMDEQEKELTSLFTGKVKTDVVTQTFTYTPTQAVVEQIFFRFSELSGLVDADDLSGVPYYITIDFEKIKVFETDKRKKKKEEVFTLLPIIANVKIENSEKKLYEDNLIIPQLGIVVPMPLETMDKYSRAYVSPSTGRLLSIEQNRKK